MAAAAPTPAAAVSTPSLSIPLIDFSTFTSPSTPPSTRLATAQSILHAFQTSGFLYLTHHPIPPALLQQTFTHSAAFFARPQVQKDALAWTTPAANRGYVATGREKVSDIVDAAGVAAVREAEGADLKETLEIGRDDEVEHPNRWPDGMDAEGVAFREHMKEFFARCRDVHVWMMRAVAVGLMGLEGEGWFDGRVGRGDNTLRLLHYPEVRREVFGDGVRVRAGAHSDYGSVTLLFQDASGGLQVQSPEGAFVDATPIANTIVVNAGDLLARWANDTIASTKHRVVQPPTAAAVHPDRYSIAYFCNPDADAWIEAIPGTYEEGKSAAEGGKRYEGVNSGDYLVQRLEATY